MSFFPRFSGWLLLTGAVTFPAAGAARPLQSSSPASPPALNEQQEAGKGVFLQNCALCHLPDKANPKSTSEEGKTIGPSLKDLFRKANPPREEVVREFIRRGTQKMPGFQYGLEPKEIENVLAYLKTL